MLLELQIIGFLFGLIMIYLTFLYYKRKDYDAKAFIFWVIVWLFFIAMVAMPSSIYGIMQQLRIQRTVDFFVIAGFLFFALVIFYLFVTVKSIQKKTEEIVREVAFCRNKCKKK